MGLSSFNSPYILQTYSSRLPTSNVIRTDTELKSLLAVYLCTNSMSA